MSESETPDTLIPARESTRKSNGRPIPRHHFEIEGKAIMIALCDGDEQNTYNEALISPAKNL